MGWRTEIREPVRRQLNALCASGRLSRRGLLRAYNSVRIELPRHACHFRATRHADDPEYFTHPVGFLDQGAWRRFFFYVNDTIETGLLVVEDVGHGIA